MLAVWIRRIEHEGPRRQAYRGVGCRLQGWSQRSREAVRCDPQGFHEARYPYDGHDSSGREQSWFVDRGMDGQMDDERSVRLLVGLDARICNM